MWYFSLFSPPSSTPQQVPERYLRYLFYGCFVYIRKPNSKHRICVLSMFYWSFIFITDHVPATATKLKTNLHFIHLNIYLASVLSHNTAAAQNIQDYASEVNSPLTWKILSFIFHFRCFLNDDWEIRKFSQYFPCYHPLASFSIFLTSSLTLFYFHSYARRKKESLLICWI